MNVLDFDRTGRIDLDWGPISLHLAGRAVFFLWVTLALLALAGIAVLVSRKRELITRWTTWALIVPVVGLPIWSGRGATGSFEAICSSSSLRSPPSKAGRNVSSSYSVAPSE